VGARKSEGLAELNAIENVQAVRPDVTVPLNQAQSCGYDRDQPVGMLEETLAANPWHRAKTS